MSKQSNAPLTMRMICGFLLALVLVSLAGYAQSNFGDPGAEANDEFGWAVARGDFNGDGFQDLAIGVVGEGITGSSGEIQGAGAVEVIYGSASGLDRSKRQFWTQRTAANVPDQASAMFGYSLATGDFNHDGYADLAIGAPGEIVSGLGGAGAVIILYGSPKGLTPQFVPSQFWTQNSPGIPDKVAFANNFGTALATGDFNHDGFADLAIGAPNEAPGGAVNVIYGSPAGLSTTAVPSQFWSQDSPNVQDAAESGDQFGWSLAVGDFNRDGFADLAIGVPSEAIGTVQYAGAVNVIYGSAAGLSSVHNQFWHQGAGGLTDAAESYDEFGLSLAVGDFNGDGFADLAIGVPKESIGTIQQAGAVNVIYGSPTGLSTTNGSQFWSQNSANVLDSSEYDDRFGCALAVGDFNGDGFADLAIGVKHEGVNGAFQAGAVNVIYGSPGGLSATAVPNQFWSQDSPGILDAAEGDAGQEIGDRFGWALVAGDFNGDGRDDLAVGVPYETLTSASGDIPYAGAVNVIYGAPSGLNATAVPNQFWTQLYTPPTP
jgi:FG-GAP repeat